MQLPHENCLFCPCLGPFAPSWGGCREQLRVILSGCRVGIFTAGLALRWLCPFSHVPCLAHPAFCRVLPVTCVSPWSLSCSGGPALAPCCPTMEAPQNSWLQEPLLSSAPSCLSFSTFQDCSHPSCSAGHRVQVSQGGSPCQGTVPAMAGFVWAQQCWDNGSARSAGLWPVGVIQPLGAGFNWKALIGCGCLGEGWNQRCPVPPHALGKF